MKQSWITNKFGWAGAVIFVLLDLFGVAMLVQVIYVVGDIFHIGGNSIIAFGIIVSGFIGFLAGLIAEKIWRKFK